MNALESLFIGFRNDTIDLKYLTARNLELIKSVLQELVQYELKKNNKVMKIDHKQLTNIYSF